MSVAPEKLHAVPALAAPDAVVIICRYARLYADRLGLRNHTIEVLEDPPSDPLALLECEIAFGRAHVRIRARDDFSDQPEYEQRLAIVHELVHALPGLQRLTERTAAVGREHIGGIAYRVFWQGFHGDIEELVDSLAQILAPQMPPVVWEA